MDNKKTEKPIIKRAKEMPKKQKIFIGIGILIVVILIGIFTIPNLLKKPEKKKKLATVSKETKDVYNKIEKINEKNSKKNSLSSTEQVTTQFEKIELFDKKYRQYEKEGRHSEAFEFLMKLLKYLNIQEKQDLAIKYIQEYNTKYLSKKQKIKFYNMAKITYEKAHYLDKSKEYQELITKLEKK